MKLGILVTPGVGTPAIVEAAEHAGFESAYFIDSPMLFGDIFVSMAVAAQRTENITLATGAVNPLTRSLPVLTTCVASLNALAPGRLILGFCRGFTANFTMGHRNATMQEMEDFIIGFRELMAGKIATADLVDGETSYLQLLNDGSPWFNTEEAIPVELAAAGPRTLEFAGRVADGVILGGITSTDVIGACLRRFKAGWGAKPNQPDVSITPSTFVTHQDLAHDELQQLLGPKSLPAAVNFSKIAQQSDDVEPKLAQDFAAVKESAYRPEPVAGQDPRASHLRGYSGYLTELKERQISLMTPEVLAATSLVGNPNEVVEQIETLRDAGITRVIIAPLPQYVQETVEMFRTAIIPQVSLS